MELWWSGKLPEPPWIHLGSSWIISGFFESFTCFTILKPFLSRLAPGWDLIESSGWKDYIFLNFKLISKVTKSGFDWRDHSAENKISKVDYTPFCARPQKSPFGPPMDHAGGECFAPYIINEAPHNAQKTIFMNIVR